MSRDRPQPLVAGNWKMNGLGESVSILRLIAQDYTGALRRSVDLVVCPPATLIGSFATAALDTGVAIGAQDCHASESGPHTGDLSAEMLADAGATYVIVGHSERRTDHAEGDDAVRAKAEAARRAGLVAIVCVGETRAEREAGQATKVVAGQLRGSLPDGATARNIVIAYEPVWAIGTGLVPTTADVADMHAMIRRELGGLVADDSASSVRILYGGSVKPANARELMNVANVNGALVGGASLFSADFLAIAGACGSG